MPELSAARNGSSGGVIVSAVPAADQRRGDQQRKPTAKQEAVLLMEEIFAYAYAAINAFGVNAPQFADEVWGKLDRIYLVKEGNGA